MVIFTKVTNGTDTKEGEKKQYNFLELFWQNYFVLVIKLQPVSDKLPVHAQIVDEMFSADFLSIYSRTYGVNSFRSAENMNHQMTVHLFGPAYWKSRENIFSDSVISQIGTRFASVCACVCVCFCAQLCVCVGIFHTAIPAQRAVFHFNYSMHVVQETWSFSITSTRLTRWRIYCYVSRHVSPTGAGNYACFFTC